LAWAWSAEAPQLLQQSDPALRWLVQKKTWCLYGLIGVVYGGF
jgi:hypothetical protein